MSKEEGGWSATGHRAATPYRVRWNVPRLAPIKIGTALDIMYGGSMGDLLALRLLHAYIGGSEPQGNKALELGWCQSQNGSVCTLVRLRCGDYY